MVSRRITALLAPAVTAAALTTGVLGLAAPVSATAATPSAKAAACDKAPWEAKVQGQPVHFGAGSPSGDYLWHDRHGFHLRVTHARHDRRGYPGGITHPAPMEVDRGRPEKGDPGALSPKPPAPPL